MRSNPSVEPNELKPQFEQYVELAHDGIAILQNGLIRYANGGLCRLRGLDRQELIGRGIDRIIAPQEVRQIEVNYHRRMSGQDVPRTYMSKALGPGEVVLDVEISATVVTYGGQPADLVILRDVTERQQVLGALEISEARYRALAEGTQDLITVYDRSHRIAYANSAVEALLGLDRQRLVGMYLEQVVLDSCQAEMVGSQMDQVFRTGRPLTIEVAHEVGQELIMLDVKMIPQFDRRGQVQTVLTTARDITRYVNMESACRRDRQRMDLALEAANEGLWDWNVRTGQVYFSPRWYTMLGYEPYSLEPGYETWRSLVHPDDLQPVLDLQMKHFATGSEGFTVEFRMRTAEGGWRWIRSCGKAVEREDDGSVRRLIGTHVDITDLKKSQGDLKRLHDRLCTLTCQEAKSEDARSRHCAERIQDRVGQQLCRIQRQIDQLVASAQDPLAAELSGISDLLAPAIVELDDLTRSLLRPSLGQPGFEQRLETICGEVFADKQVDCRIQAEQGSDPPSAEACLILIRCIRELLHNIAVHAGASHVDVIVGRQSAGWQVTICDDGIGLGGRSQAQLEACSQDLGLFSICRAMENFGGSCVLTEAPGRGTAAMLRLPAGGGSIG
ncbi:MAG: PAS domain S-box protein [Phycisphaerae bacterium]